MSNYEEYRGTIVTKGLEKDKLAGFKGRDSDVWICGFPRSGTTLLQEMTYLVNTGNFQKALTVPLPQRVLFADMRDLRIPFHEGLSACERADDPRMFKSHLHYFLLPEHVRAGKGRIVYVARHPAPTALSLYGLMCHFRCVEASGGLRQFVDLFLADKAYGCPWWLHVLQFWEHRHEDHVLFLLYEDIVRDKRRAICRIAEFLDKDLTDEDVGRILEHTDIESMRHNDMVNFTFVQQCVATDNSQNFINTGTVDGWKQRIPVDLAERISEMLQHRLGHTDIHFSS